MAELQGVKSGESAGIAEDRKANCIYIHFYIMTLWTF